MTQWQQGLHHQIARGLRRSRAGRSAQWLADQTARLGFPISRAAIANYESGRKKTLDVAELIVLAAALGVPPVALIFPDLPDGPTELLPGLPCTAGQAALWFCGESLEVSEAVASRAELSPLEVWGASASLSYTRELANLDRVIADLYAQLKHLASERDNPLVEQAGIAARARLLEDELRDTEKRRERTAKRLKGLTADA